VGAQSPDHPLNAIYLWTSGPDEGVLQVQLRHGCKVRVDELRERLRGAIARRIPEIQVSFEPSDIVSRVLSFGSPTPVEISVSSSDIATNRKVAEKIRGELGKIASLRDLHIEQELDYPTIQVDVDRKRAGLLGVTVNQVAGSFVPATSSSKYVEKNFWADP